MTDWKLIFATSMIANISDESYAGARSIGGALKYKLLICENLRRSKALKVNRLVQIQLIFWSLVEACW